MILVFNRFRQPIIVISFVLILIGLFLEGVGMSELNAIALMLATIIAGMPIAIKALQSIKMKLFSIDLLVIIAIIGAIYIQEYTESAIVSFLFLFGDYLEMRTLEKTRSSLKSLIEMAPQEAIVIRGTQTITLPVEKVIEGDLVLIRSGGKIPVDGKIVSGQATINEAAITGESTPVSKTMHDKVFSGALVDNGYIEIIAEKVGDNTIFAKIIELVEEAQQAKSKTEKFLNQFSKVYTPAVVTLAILVFFLTKDLRIAITFLVIACPGALVIGAPVSTVAGIGNGAKNGVLVKGGETMDRFSKVDTLVFDKTGTLTKGKPEVTDIEIFTNFETNTLLRLVALAETISEHPLGQVIVKEAQARRINLHGEIKNGKIIKGSGISAIVENTPLIIGNRKLMKAEQIEISQEVSDYAVMREKAGNTAIFAAVNGKIAGIFSIADQIREDARDSLTELRKNGVKKMIMLTGDNRYTAEIVARKLGLDEFYAELLPEDKVQYVKKLKETGHIVAMAGDGINDAPAIAIADIGLAMGEGGTDISMETADVVLMADKLSQLSHAFSLSKATIRNMKQNTYFAVAIVFTLLIGVLNNTIHLASGMFIHEASVLIVILNAMRLSRFQLKNRNVNPKLQVVKV
ncbi:heavy metal translocating P-type ATPase [Neobacillus sp. SM06]|uniref:heavy metal translocating P-type ATPase n=1 Tax=Neobacillus sp. SM06 TaxID=3422492 RepID=UPI003D27071A